MDGSMDGERGIGVLHCVIVRSCAVPIESERTHTHALTSHVSQNDDDA